MDQVEAITQALRVIMDIVDSQGIDSLDDEVKSELASLINAATQRINELRAEVTQTPQDAENAEILWILAGGNEQAFVEYLRNFPDGNNSALLNNPQLLQQTILNLRERYGEGIDLQADGIPHGPLMSSNVYGFIYDDKTGKLKVRFNEGGVYEYSGVPKQVYQMFASGAHPATTKGENRFGKWWIGKNPSIGSAFHNYIKLAGFPFTKLK